MKYGLQPKNFEKELFGLAKKTLNIAGETEKHMNYN